MDGNKFKESQLSLCKKCINIQKDCSFVHKICTFPKTKKKDVTSATAYVSKCAEYKETNG